MHRDGKHGSVVSLPCNSGVSPHLLRPAMARQERPRPGALQARIDCFFRTGAWGYSLQTPSVQRDRRLPMM
jgi:hypothetical protein